MADLYVTYLNVLFNNSISLANLFSNIAINSQYGSWGLFQFLDSRPTETQKWLGVSNYITQFNYTN
jgi:hypothetical protein